MNKRIRVVVVRPEEYPETAVLESVEPWFEGEYIKIPLTRTER